MPLYSVCAGLLYIFVLLSLLMCGNYKDCWTLRENRRKKNDESEVLLEKKCPPFQPLCAHTLYYSPQKFSLTCNKCEKRRKWKKSGFGKNEKKTIRLHLTEKICLDFSWFTLVLSHGHSCSYELCVQIKTNKFFIFFGACFFGGKREAMFS